jgi:hypothetical protein
MASDYIRPFGGVGGIMTVGVMFTFPPACIGTFDSENVLGSISLAISSPMKFDSHSEHAVSSCSPDPDRR